jgi:transposase
MGQRQKILTQILGFDGFKVDGHFEGVSGRRLAETALPSEFRGATLVLTTERCWLPRCSACGAVCRKVHERLPPRRWRDLPWAEHAVVIEYAPIRVRCGSCKTTPVELLPWADPGQRQTKRLQHHLAVQCASMPITHVAALNGLDWSTVRRAEDAALQRWERTRPEVALFCVGVDEKYLGRRGRWPNRFVTIVSNLDTGEPIWTALVGLTLAARWFRWRQRWRCTRG